MITHPTNRDNTNWANERPVTTILFIAQDNVYQLPNTPGQDGVLFLGSSIHQTSVWHARGLFKPLC